MQRAVSYQEFLQFLHYIEAAVPQALDVHLIVDNDATHKHAKVRRWLAARLRFHVHCTPYASWLNQVEIWFNIITQRVARRLRPETWRACGHDRRRGESGDRFGWKDWIPDPCALLDRTFLGRIGYPFR